MRWFLVVLSLCVSGAAIAQTVRLTPKNGQLAGQVTATTGFERALLPLTLSGSLGLTGFDRPLTLTAAVTMPMSSPDLGDLRGTLAAGFDLNPNQGWLVRLTPSLLLSGTSNEAYRAVAFGAELGALVGWSSRCWLVGAEVVDGLTIVTALTTREYARVIGGAAVVDAVRWAPSTQLELGLRAGVLLGPVELSLRAGFDRKGVYNLAIPPVYATLGLGVRFGG